MTEETTEISEPPDPLPNYNPGNLKYELNGRGSPSRLFQLEEATYKGRTFVRKVGTNIVYEQRGQDSYVCIKCDTPTEESRVSREISRGWGKHDIIMCGPAHFCPKCEDLPKTRGIKGLIERITESEYSKRIKEYERLHSK